MLSGAVAWFAIVVALALIAAASEAQSTFQDPAVPIIRLPIRFSSHRVNADWEVPEGGVVEIADLRGPGCVRHIWLYAEDGYRLEINVDGVDAPQIDVPLQPFFGVMNGLAPYPIDCAAYTVLPNPVPDPRIPGTPGYNLFMPIPFAESCRIALDVPPGGHASAMVDWHQYDDGTDITPYRFHADHRLYKPSAPRGNFIEMANIDGEGFVAGFVQGFIQRDYTDMVFHTGGTMLLIDGETSPHVISGHNVEDDFGFTWGFNDHQSRWIGCPYQVNRGRTDQDGVFYRFFGPDPIAFRNSLVFRAGCRGDDMESVVYYYRVPRSTAPEIVTPSKWQIAGPIAGGGDWDTFARSEFVEDLQPGPWPETLADGEMQLPVEVLPTDHGWVDVRNVMHEKHHTATPLGLLDASAYVRATVQSAEARRGILRLAFDDWCIAWLNGEKVAELRHDRGVETARIAVELRGGPNEILLKMNNTDGPPNRRLWVLHCAIE